MYAPWATLRMQCAIKDSSHPRASDRCAFWMEDVGRTEPLVVAKTSLRNISAPMANETGGTHASMQGIRRWSCITPLLASAGFEPSCAGGERDQTQRCVADGENERESCIFACRGLPRAHKFSMRKVVKVRIADRTSGQQTALGPIARECGKSVVVSPSNCLGASVEQEQLRWCVHDGHRSLDSSAKQRRRHREDSPPDVPCSPSSKASSNVFFPLRAVRMAGRHKGAHLNVDG